jgi:hypothetical protein
MLKRLSLIIASTVLFCLAAPLSASATAPSVSLDALSFQRGGDGVASWSGDVSSSGSFGGNPCRVYLQAERVGGGTVGLGNSVTLVPGTAQTLVGSTASTNYEYMRIRAAVSCLTLAYYSAWTNVDDAVAPYSIGLEIDTFTQSGVMTWSLAATVANARSQTVVQAPRVVIQGRTASGSVRLIASTSIVPSTYLGTYLFSGSQTSSYTYTSIRAEVLGLWNVASTGWIPMSGDIVDGHDIEAAAAAWEAAYVAYGAGACVAALPIGPHTQNTSTNDYQNACLAAVASGKTGAQIFKLLLTSFGDNLVNSFLVWANYGSGTQQPTTTNPSDWDWTGYEPSLPPGTPPPSNPAPRPIESPPPLDPIYENNVLAAMMASGKIWGGEFTQAQKLEQAREVLRACVKQAVMGAGHSEEDCETMPIFSPGSNVLEAASHDFDAILGEPQWSVLVFRTAAEKLGAGVGHTWKNSEPVCQANTDSAKQCDEYPFYSSLEGGPGASLRVIDGVQNGLEGTYYGAFAQICGLRNVSLPDSERSFIVVPLPYEGGPLTSGWCKR